MQTKSINIELPDQLYYKIGVVASGRFETIKEYLSKLVSGSLREELELGDIKREIAYGYAADEMSCESLKALPGVKEAERIRIYRETTFESIREADNAAKS